MSETLGLLLAGGQARRMGGGDKCLQVLGGHTLLAHAIERARPQVDRLLLNVAVDAGRFAAYGLEVIADAAPGYLGPLAGVLAGMEWAAREMGETAWVATFPTDAPFFPTDLVASLRRAIADEGADMACAMSLGRAHPVFGLWPVRLRDDLRHALLDEDIRKVDRWTARYAIVHVPFAANPVDPFFNINTPKDLARAEAFLA